MNGEFMIHGGGGGRISKALFSCLPPSPVENQQSLPYKKDLLSIKYLHKLFL